MHVTGRDKVNEGKFEFTCYDWKGNVYKTQNNIATSAECGELAANAERLMTMEMLDPTPRMTLDEIFADLESLDAEIAAMSDDELLAELQA